jgi:hypothetical protein
MMTLPLRRHVNLSNIIGGSAANRFTGEGEEGSEPMASTYVIHTEMSRSIKEQILTLQ